LKRRLPFPRLGKGAIINTVGPSRSRAGLLYIDWESFSAEVIESLPGRGWRGTSNEPLSVEPGPSAF
jgi:hypothetical protein